MFRYLRTAVLAWFRNHSKSIVIAFALSIGLIIGIGWVYPALQSWNAAHPSALPVATIAPAPVQAVEGLEALPNEPPPGNDEEGRCHKLLGTSWDTRLVPAVKAYFSFPTHEPVQPKLDLLKRYFTQEFYRTTAQTWAVSTSPHSWVTNVAVEGCLLGRRYNFAQVVGVSVDITFIDAQKVRAHSSATYDVLVVQANGSFYIGNILLPGSLKD